MKRIRCLLASVLLLSCAVSVHAQGAQGDYSFEERIEFARTLRDKKGYADLALQYLEDIQNPPGEVKQTVRFEIARTRLRTARGLDPEERLEAISQARGELEQFLKEFGTSKQADVVRQELRRLPAEQAQATLSLALRMRGIEAKQEMANEAKKFFLQAAAELEAVKDSGNDFHKEQIRYELAVNKMELARCFVNLGSDAIRGKRAQLVSEARTMFEQLAFNSNDRVGLSARAWLIKCCSEDEGSDPLKADEYYEQIRNLTIKDAEEARRLARYFQMVRIPVIATPKNPVSALNRYERFQKVQAEAEAWLKAYPAHAKTPVGYGVRYELANALYNQALLIKDAQSRQKLFARAQDLLYALSESDNDLVGKVDELRSRIAFVYVSTQAHSKINELATFDECFVRGRLEFDRVNNLRKKYEETKDKEARSKIEKDLKDRLRDLTDALSRALLVADRKTPRYALENARSSLLDAYAIRESPILTNAPYRTIIYGEALARANPPSKHSPRALEMAIDACVRLINVDPSAANRDRLRGLAEFAISPERRKLWEKKSVVSLALYHLGMLDQAEATLFFAEAEKLKDRADAAGEALKAGRDKFGRALQHLHSILPSDPSRYFYARGKAVLLAVEARDRVPFPEEKKYYRDLARKLIADLPRQLDEGVDSAAVNIYFFARMEEAKFLYEEAQIAARKDPDSAQTKFQAMSEYLERMSKELEGPAVKMSKLDDARVQQLAYYIAGMEKYAIFGLADFEYRAGRFDKVLEPGLTGKVVGLVAALAEKNPVVRLKDFQITGQIVSLALRASIQTGKFDEAKKLMKLLEGLKDEKDNLLAESSGALRSLVNELDVEVRDLQRKGEQARLKKTQENFTAFLDELRSDADRRFEKRDLLPLARCYDTLDQHDKAAALYGQFLTTPDAGRKDAVPEYLNKARKEKFSNEEELELQTYCYAQVMLARQLRLAKKTTEGKKILDNLAKQVNARQLLLVEKEQIYLLQDGGLYGTASTRWDNFLKSPAFKTSGIDEERKRLYFEAYFNRSYCLCKYGLSDKVKGAGKEGPYLSRAAEYLVRLETAPNKEGWQYVEHRVQELLRQERALKEIYDKQKAGN